MSLLLFLLLLLLLLLLVLTSIKLQKNSRQHFSFSKTRERINTYTRNIFHDGGHGPYDVAWQFTSGQLQLILSAGGCSCSIAALKHNHTDAHSCDYDNCI